MTGLVDHALEQLANDPEREPLLELGRPRAEHAEAEVERTAAPDLEQPRLADAGSPLDPDDCALAPTDRA